MKKTGGIHCVLKIARGINPYVGASLTKHCLFVHSSEAITYLLQKSVMWWIYVHLLEDFNDTNYKLSQKTAKIFKILLIITTIGLIFLGILVPIYVCKCANNPYWHFVVPIAGFADFMLSVVLLSFYISNLIKLLNFFKHFMKRNSQYAANNVSKSDLKRQKKIQLIVSVAKRHTFWVVLSITSTWLTVLMPIIIYVSTCLICKIKQKFMEKNCVFLNFTFYVFFVFCFCLA